MPSDHLYWIAAIITALAAQSLLTWALFFDRARGWRRCPNCWYDVSGSAPGNLRCSECGRAVRNERQFGRTRRRWRWAAVAAVGMLASGYLAVQPQVRKGGWASIVPSTVLVLGLHAPYPNWAVNALHHRVITNFNQWTRSADWDALTADEWSLCMNGCAKVLCGTPSSEVCRKALDLLESGLFVTPTELVDAAAFAGFDSAMRHTDPLVRMTAAFVAARDPQYGRAMDRLETLIADNDPHVRLAAAYAMARIGNPDTLAFDVASLRMLIAQGRPPRIASLGGFTTHIDSTMRVEVKRRLIRIALHHDDVRVRAISMDVLALFAGDDEDISALIDDAVANPNNEIVASGFALAKKSKGPFPVTLVDRTVACLISSDGSVRGAAAEFLADIPGEQLVAYADELQELSWKSGDANVRNATRYKVMQVFKVLPRPDDVSVNGLREN